MKWRSEYSETTMERRRERVQQARQTDIIEIAKDLGYDFVDEYTNGTRGGKNQGVTKVIVENGKRIFLTGCTFFKNGTNPDKGHTVDFVMKYGNMSFNEALDFIVGAKDMSTPLKPKRIVHEQAPKVKEKITIDDVKKQVEESQFDASTFKAPTERTIKYLTETRKLDKSIVDYLVSKRLIMSDKYNNACFMSYYDGKVVGANKRGIVDKPDVKPFKGIHRGSSGLVGCHLVKGKPQRILFFEGTIDLISYLTIYKNQPKLNNCVFATVTGLKMSTIEAFMAMFPGATPVFCLDNDDAATEFLKVLEETIGKIEKESPGEYKDWNEMLIKGVK